ncbi:MAG: hypothetical protein ABIM74_10585 [candidate division WOR-3 bacterium]
MARVELLKVEHLRDGRFIATFQMGGSRFKVVGPAEDWPEELFDATPAIDDREYREVDRLLSEAGIDTKDLQWIDVAEEDWALIEKARFVRLSKGGGEDWTEEEETKE